MVRVAIDNLGTTEPSTLPRPRRFSPVHDSRGAVVPVLYAGDSFTCALGETVFHDLPDDETTDASVLRADLLTVRAGFFTVTRDIELDLTDASLRRLRVAGARVVDTPPTSYDDTVAYARAAWRSTRAAGLVWNSRRHRTGRAYLLFVDPPRAADGRRAVDRRRDLAVTSPPLPLHDGRGLELVLTAATDRGVAIVF